jgi:nucleoside-diphosphate-sugar epimerase
MVSSKHLVVGAGAIGSAVARKLAAAGKDVIVVTRSGSGPDLPNVERVAADAGDAVRLSELATGAEVIYNCLNPRYHRWPLDWPPMAQALLAAAESSGAVLSTCSNLYGYGPVSAPMTESTPLAATGTKAKVRIQMWKDALDLHNSGRIRATEARGSDYIGPGSQSLLGDLVVPRIQAGKSVWLVGNPDVDHTFTYTEDMAATLIAIGSDPRAWGRAWHVPSAMTMTQRQAVEALASVAGVGKPKSSSIPSVVLGTMGLFNPEIREFKETDYQRQRTYVMDSTAARSELGLEPTPVPEILSAVVNAYRTAS